MCPVKASLNLDDFIPACSAARHANSRHGSLSAGADEAEHFHAWVKPGDPLGCRNLQQGGSSIKPASGHLIGCSLNNGRMAMAQDHGPICQAVIDEPVAIGIP